MNIDVKVTLTFSKDEEGKAFEEIKKMEKVNYKQLTDSGYITLKRRVIVMELQKSE